MTKSNILPSVILGCICLVVAILLAGVNMITAPIIEERQNALQNAALIDVLPNGSNFETIEITADYPSVVTDGWKADGGFVFRTEVAGYNPGLIIMCGIDTEGKIVGVKHIVTNETYGFEGELNQAYIGETLDTAELIIASGASAKSKTSKAYYDAIKASLQASVLAAGGSVDTRSPEQIFQDNCNLALGTSGETFKRWFMTEILVDVKNVYKSASGLVMIVGDKFVGLKNDGTVVNVASNDGTVSAPQADEEAIVTAAYTLYSGTTSSEIESPKGASKRVTKIEITATGNYVMYMEAAGNGINGEEYSHPSGEYIEFMVSISPEGKIIDVMTTYQSESDGWGNYCATDEYTEQFKGAVSSDIVITEDGTSKDSTDLGVISGSTVTSNGYQQALQRAFKAFDLLTATEEGGND